MLSRRFVQQNAKITREVKRISLAAQPLLELATCSWISVHNRPYSLDAFV